MVICARSVWRTKLIRRTASDAHSPMTKHARSGIVSNTAGRIKALHCPRTVLPNRSSSGPVKPCLLLFADFMQTITAMQCLLLMYDRCSEPTLYLEFCTD